MLYATWQPKNMLAVTTQYTCSCWKLKKGQDYHPGRLIKLFWLSMLVKRLSCSHLNAIVFLLATCWLLSTYYVSFSLSFLTVSLPFGVSVLCLLNFCPFNLPPPSRLLTAMCYWPTTPTHLFCNFLTCSVKKSCLLVDSTLPNFPHYLLILKRMEGVRQHWLYSPPFPSPVKHLFYDDTIFLSCNEKELTFLAKSCAWDREKKGKFHWIFCLCLHPVQHDTSPTVRVG